MGDSLHDVGRPDVDDVAANGAGRVEGQSLVLLDGEVVQLAFIHGTLIHSIGNRSVDQLAAHTNTCTHQMWLLIV